MSVINTSNYSSVTELSNALQEVAKHNETAFLLVDEQIFMLVPAEIAKEQIAEKIALRLAENPTILHDIQTRLETEAPEDWE